MCIVFLFYPNTTDDWCMYVSLHYFLLHLDDNCGWSSWGRKLGPGKSKRPGYTYWLTWLDNPGNQDEQIFQNKSHTLPLTTYVCIFFNVMLFGRIMKILGFRDQIRLTFLVQRNNFRTMSVTVTTNHFYNDYSQSLLELTVRLYKVQWNSVIMNSSGPAIFVRYNWGSL